MVNLPSIRGEMSTSGVNKGRFVWDVYVSSEMKFDELFSVG